MLKSVLTSVLLIFSVQAGAAPGDLVKVQFLNEVPASIVPTARQSYCPAIAHLPAIGYSNYKVTFKTSDLKGQETESNGLLIVPKTVSASPIYVYQHGTLFGRHELPSSNAIRGENSASGICFSSLGYISVLADYLGFGDSTGVHPYLHADSEAWVGRDMLRASEKALVEIAFTWNKQLFIAGYSQGGHAAMALMRLLEKEGEYTITAAAPMAGPYALAETIAEIPANPTPNSPAEAAYLVVGLNQIYGYYTELSEALVPEFAAIVPQLLDGSKGWLEVRQVLSVPLDKLLQPYYLQEVIKDAQSGFMKALQANEVYKWVPRAPVLLLHGRGDHEVPYSNAEVALEYMKSRGATIELMNLGDTVDHQAGAPLAFGQAALWFQTFR